MLPAPVVSIRRWTCRECGKLFFEAYLPPDSYVIIKCYRCSHVNVIKPTEYSAAMNDAAANEVIKCSETLTQS